MKNKRIAFLLPGRSPKGPIGGYKVVYEYANRLVENGFDVTILYPLSINQPYSIREVFKSIARYLKWKLTGMSGRNWFKLNKKVSERIVNTLDYSNIGDFDCYIATQVKTSFSLAKYPIDNNRKFYLIQDFETWLVPEDIVRKSYLLGLRNIVISNWLLQYIEKIGSSAMLIKNGFDFDYFKLSNKIEDRNPQSIVMLYHNDNRKGCIFGIQAIEKLKITYPKLHVILFGVPSRPDSLPDWIDYVQKPDRATHNKIYNHTAIYLAPSIQEGWGLTVGEAMICGAAIVCSEAEGFKEMITDNVNGLITKIGDVDDIYDKISYLIDNNQRRIEIATKGNQSINNFTWDNSYKSLVSLIEN